MKPKEARRLAVMDLVLSGKLRVSHAAGNLGLSRRQVHRIKRAMQVEGPAALQHKGRGRPSHRAIQEHVRSRVQSQATGELRGASWIHMAELMEEREGIKLSPKTIGRILTSAGVKNPHSHRAPRKRRSRERRLQEGLLVQIDASPHDWLENRGPRMSLHGAIDDATGKVLGLHFRLQEDIVGYFEMIRQMSVNFGVPLDIYTDRHTMFVSPKSQRLTIEEQLAKQKAPLTQLGRVFEALGMNHIKALSPQAKGRVERLWQTLQERLVVELRIANIDSLEAANEFLVTYKPEFNERFAVEARDPKLAYRRRPPLRELEEILCFHHQRRATNGSTFSFEGQLYQLVDKHDNVIPLRTGQSITIHQHVNGELKAHTLNHHYNLRPTERTPKPEPKERSPRDPSTYAKPTEDHPWKRQLKNLKLAKQRRAEMQKV